MRGTSLVVALIFTGSVVTAAALTKQQSDAFAKRIILVQKMAGEKSAKDRPTTFTQDETNSYLKFGAGDLMPTGLTQPEIIMLGQGKVTGNAVVDLDIVRQKSGSGSWFDPTSYLTGKLPVTATGRIVTWDGKGKFELETASVTGVPIPKAFLAQMVNFFTRTADNPKGASIDDTFELPAEIKRIDVQQGRFVLHQ